MKRNYRYIISVCGLLFLSALTADSVEIVYPKSTEIVINSESSFFIGNENPAYNLTVNSEPVKLYSDGAFNHPVKLNLGENIFTIDNGISKPIIYRITRANNTVKPGTEKEVLYKQSLFFVSAKDNVPLRSTPYDCGINRLQHLEKGIPLKVIGEFDDFYKVQLARDDYAWILKGNVIKSDKVSEILAKIESFEYCETPNNRVFTLKLTDKVPYVLSEATNGFDLVVYSVKGYPENKYEFHINPQGKPFGYKTYYKDNNELVVEIKNFPTVEKSEPLTGLNITIDPGHGGNDAGAVGCLGDKEKDINLAISLKLRDILQKSGANVFLTREDDSVVSLSERVKASQRNESDIFISIHNNALPDSLAFSDKSGSSVFYFYPQSKPLGTAILKSLVSAGMNDDKVRRESFAVVRNTESLAVLVEVGYMIRPEDNAKLINEEFQNQAAEVIKQGMENYFNDI